jgi:hypothetical protein
VIEAGTKSLTQKTNIPIASLNIATIVISTTIRDNHELD